MIKSTKKFLGTNILVEKDEDGVFIVSLTGVQGAHADGKTIERAIKNLNEVVALLKEYYGEKNFLKRLKNESRFFGVIPYDVEYT